MVDVKTGRTEVSEHYRSIADHSIGRRRMQRSPMWQTRCIKAGFDTAECSSTGRRRNKTCCNKHYKVSSVSSSQEDWKATCPRLACWSCLYPLDCLSCVYRGQQQALAKVHTAMPLEAWSSSSAGDVWLACLNRRRIIRQVAKLWTANF